MNNSREWVAATRPSSQGTSRLPTTNVSPTIAASLIDGQADRDRESPAPPGAGAEDGRQQDQHQDGEKILDNQPADRDVARRRMQVAAFRQHPHEDNSARHRDSQTEDDRRTTSPSRGSRRAACRAPSRPGFGPGRPVKRRA